MEEKISQKIMPKLKKNNKKLWEEKKSKNSVEGEKIVMRGKNNEGEKINEGVFLDTEKEDMALAIKQALEQVKLNAKGSEEEREHVRLGAVVGDISYADFFKEKEISHVGDASKLIGGTNVTRKFHSDNEDVVWESKGALARVLNGNFIPIVQQKIIDAGFDNVWVLPRGGDNVVLFCPGKEDMMLVYHKAADFFNCFFSEMPAWSLAEDNVSERGVWFQIYGVPLHVWHIKILEFISS